MRPCWDCTLLGRLRYSPEQTQLRGLISLQLQLSVVSMADSHGSGNINLSFSHEAALLAHETMSTRWAEARILSLESMVSLLGISIIGEDPSLQPSGKRPESRWKGRKSQVDLWEAVKHQVSHDQHLLRVLRHIHSIAPKTTPREEKSGRTRRKEARIPKAAKWFLSVQKKIWWSHSSPGISWILGSSVSFACLTWSSSSFSTPCRALIGISLHASSPPSRREVHTYNH